MCFYDKTPDKGIGYLKKSFAWLPTKVNGCTVWFEYYWHFMYWDDFHKKYKPAQMVTVQNKLLEERNAT